MLPDEISLTVGNKYISTTLVLFACQLTFNSHNPGSGDREGIDTLNFKMRKGGASGMSEYYLSSPKLFMTELYFKIRFSVLRYNVLSEIHATAH